MEAYEYTWTRRRIAELGPTITSPADARRALEPLLTGAERERLAVAYLSTKNAVIGTELAYMGSVSSCTVNIGELFRGAIRIGAAQILIAHNHPSEDPTPSPEDLLVTRQIVEASELLSVPLVDHLILGGTRWLSLRDHGVPMGRRP